MDAFPRQPGDPPRPGVFTIFRAVVSRRSQDERGATIVEAAFVTPVFVLLVFAIIELSGFVMARSSAGAAVKAGARMASVQGDNPMAEREILRRISQEGSGMVGSYDVIEEIKIWKAASVHDDPPTTCDQAHHCNSYVTPNQVDRAFELANLPLSSDGGGGILDSTKADCYFGAMNHTDTWCESRRLKLDANWYPGQRRVLEKDPNHTGSCPDLVAVAGGGTRDRCATTDLVGIWMKVHHEYYTGFFGDGPTFEVQSIAKIESQDYDRVTS